MSTDLTIEYTLRGFKVIAFIDDGGEQCSLQESSRIEPMIWLGIDTPRIRAFFPYQAEPWRDVTIEKPPGAKELLHGGRMHLTREQVAALLPYLQHFAETGELPAGELAPVPIPQLEDEEAS